MPGTDVSALNKTRIFYRAQPERRSFSSQVKLLAARRGLSVYELILLADLEKRRGIMVASGVLPPSRDEVIRLGLALHTTLYEMQLLLRTAGKHELSLPVKRDALVIFCLDRALPVVRCQNMLRRQGLQELG